MLQFAIRVLLSALVFTYVVPKIAGAQFSGRFWPDGIVYGLLLAAVAWALGLLVGVVAAGTGGLALLLIVPAVILGFWLVPAIELRILAHCFPQDLSFSGWGSAIIAGFVFLIVNLLTHHAVMPEL